MSTARQLSNGVLLLCLSFSLGCSRHSAQRASVPRRDNPIVVSPLAAQVDDTRQLLSINSLAIAKPTYLTASPTTISEDSLLQVVREVASETLSMKLVSGDVGAEKKSVVADGVLRTEVLELEALRGSSVGGEPAAVSMRMLVVRKGESRPVWQASYVYRQEQLSDNWLKIGDRIGRGGTGPGWVSAQDLFKRGVTEALEDFNRRRDAQFQSEGATR